MESALIPKYESEMKAIAGRIDLLESRLSRIVRKPDGDFITERSRAVLDEYARQYKMVLLQRDLHKAALSLLQKYKFDFERLECAEDGLLSVEAYDIGEIFKGARKNFFYPGNIEIRKGGGK